MMSLLHVEFCKPAPLRAELMYVLKLPLLLDKPAAGNAAAPR
jgi:hypothetical protein